MQIEILERTFSKSRLETYYKLFPNDKEKAIEYYQLNIQISESFYPLLSNFEVALRNSIHHSFSIHYNTESWFEKINYPELLDQIKTAKSKILIQKKEITNDKLVSELTLGFWTALFNKKFAKDYWKPLIYAFPMLEKEQKHRNIIAFKLNNIRKFRNRIFHFEPICNELTILEINHRNIIEALEWMNLEIVDWNRKMDRFDILFKEVQKFKMKEQ